MCGSAAPACTHRGQALGLVRLQTSVTSRVGSIPSASAGAPVVISLAAGVPVYLTAWVIQAAALSQVMVALPRREPVRKTAWWSTALACMAAGRVPPRAEMAGPEVLAGRQLIHAAATAGHQSPRCSPPASPRWQRGHAPNALLCLCHAKFASGAGAHG